MSSVAAEYSKEPVNMNRKQWETEQNCGDFIKGDIQYCRNKAESFEEFIFLMEKLGYEVNVGAHISVKAEGMRRSRRLDTLDEEFSMWNRLYIIWAMLCIRNRLMLFSSGIMESCIVCVWCRNADFSTSTQGISRTLSV